MNGAAGNDWLNGGGGADRLIGGAGNDTYYTYGQGETVVEAANGGNDTVVAYASFTLPAKVETLFLYGDAPKNGYGNATANLIAGSASADTLDGRGGQDTLVGGDGADTFQITSTIKVGNLARISDFEQGSDRIALDDVVFKGIGTAGPLDAKYFALDAATTRDQHIIYDTTSGDLLYDRDGSGTTYAAVVFAHLEVAPALTAGDIVVI